MAAEPVVEDLINNLEQVNFIDLEVGHPYFIIKVGGGFPVIPRRITIASIRPNLREYEGIGRWGFIVTTTQGDSTYAAYEIEPPPNHVLYRTFGITRFYEVPPQNVMNSIIAQWRNQQPMIQVIPQFLNAAHNVPAIAQNIPHLGNTPPPLSIEDARYIGTLKLDLKKKFPDGNSITYTQFIPGNEYVRLQKNNNYIFTEESLQQTWDTGRRINPLTNEVIQQKDIELFTYEYVPENIGGRRKKSRKSRKDRKSRRSRKARKSRKSRKARKSRKSRKSNHSYK